MSSKRTHLCLVLLYLLLGACSAHPKKVDCEGHLQPINPPARASASNAKDVRP